MSKIDLKMVEEMQCFWKYVQRFIHTVGNCLIRNYVRIEFYLYGCHSTLNIFFNKYLLKIYVWLNTAVMKVTDGTYCFYKMKQEDLMNIIVIMSQKLL